MGHTEHYEEADGEGATVQKVGKKSAERIQCREGGEEQALLAAVSSPEKMFNPQKDLRSKTNGAFTTHSGW